MHSTEVCCLLFLGTAKLVEDTIRTERMFDFKFSIFPTHGALRGGIV